MELFELFTNEAFVGWCMSMVVLLMPRARRNSETEVQEVCCHFMLDYNSSFINA